MAQLITPDTKRRHGENMSKKYDPSIVPPAILTNNLPRVLQLQLTTQLGTTMARDPSTTITWDLSEKPRIVAGTFP